ncbi:hypothetical protein Tco_1055539 [Tanacetum coccineum]|uniref:Uncharacterized protein n=1 Tax=Tanacetum coccineum TaxID=301880 RepID=A0ABQ5GZZ9_9ASTR
MASGGNDRDAEDALYKLLQMVASQIELLRARPTTLGEAFSLARVTEARLEEEQSTTSIAKPNDLNPRVEVQDLEKTTRHKPNKVEAIKASGSILLVESKYYAANQVGLIFNQSNEATYYERILELIAGQLCQYLYVQVFYEGISYSIQLVHFNFPTRRLVLARKALAKSIVGVRDNSASPFVPLGQLPLNSN